MGNVQGQLRESTARCALAVPVRCLISTFHCQIRLLITDEREDQALCGQRSDNA